MAKETSNNASPDLDIVDVFNIGALQGVVPY